DPWALDEKSPPTNRMFPRLAFQTRNREHTTCIFKREVGNTRLRAEGFSWSVAGAGDRAAITPDIDRGEQEQPHHVDEVPVPGGRLEAEMLLRREIALVKTQQADREEDRADHDMEAV